MKHALPYPPPWIDIMGLCAHFPISESSVDNYIKLHKFPAGRMRAGKRVWKYSEVEAWYDGGADKVEELNDLERVRHDTREAANAR